MMFARTCFLAVLVAVIVLSGVSVSYMGAVDKGSAWEETAKLLPSDGAANDQFGYTVSVSGDTALVGAWWDDDNGTDSGSAYPFVRSGDVWTEQAKLLASDGAADDKFGGSVSVSGDTALVGARYDDDKGTDSGSAYVFVRSGDVWTEQAKLLASDGAANDQFGYTVSVSGDTALVGAVLDDSFVGSAYVFVRSGGVWAEQAKLQASDGDDFENYAASLSVSENTALIGAATDGDNGPNSGSAYVFVRSGDVWSEQAKLLASDGVAFDNFGFSVSLSGDTALVGTFGDDDNGSASGSAYVFVRSGDVWTEQAKLLASDGAAGDWLGFSVSVSGDTGLVAAVRDDDNGPSSGSAYVFVRRGDIWTEQAKLLASDGAADDLFGDSVSVSGDTALIGAWWDDDNGTDSGSAYVFGGSIFADGFESGDTSAWSSTVPWTVSGWRER